MYAALVTLPGIAAVVTASISGASLFGSVLAVGAGVAYIANFLLQREQSRAERFQAIVLGNAGVAATGLALCLFQMATLPRSPWWWLVILTLGVLQAAPLSISAFALDDAAKNTAHEALLFRSLAPVMSVLLVFAASRTMPSPRMWAGLGVICLAVTIYAVATRRRSHG